MRGHGHGKGEGGGGRVVSIVAHNTLHRAVSWCSRKAHGDGKTGLSKHTRPQHHSTPVSTSNRGIRSAGTERAGNTEAVSPRGIVPTSMVSADTGRGGGSPARPAILNQRGAENLTRTSDNAATPVEARKMTTTNESPWSHTGACEHM